MDGIQFHLANGAKVTNGSHLGVFPCLADHQLPSSSFVLLDSAANPRMDLILLIGKDAQSSSSSSNGPPRPPGMSIAQFALVQRMLSKQKGGGGASHQTGPPQPRKGDDIVISLWRLGENSSCAWKVSIVVDKLLDPVEGIEQEYQDVEVHDACWSPDGDRVAVLVSVKRSKLDDHQQQQQQLVAQRVITVVKTYSVHDGTLLSTTTVCPSTTSGNDHATAINLSQLFSHPATLSWISTVDLAPNTPVSPTESLLCKLKPLPALPSVQKLAASTSNLMPHQIRMMQIGMQRAQPGLELPTQTAQQGRGPLSRIPCLSRNPIDLGLVERTERKDSPPGPPPPPSASASANQTDTATTTPLPHSIHQLNLSSSSVIAVCRPRLGTLDLFLDGTIQFASCLLPSVSESNLIYMANDLSRLDLALFHVDSSTASSITMSTVDLPFPPSKPSYAPCSMGLFIAKLGRLSHLLRTFIGYALDTASILAHLWSKNMKQTVLAEWNKNVNELAQKYGCDIKLEMLSVLVTARAAPAVEQLLLANLTEGVVSRIENQTHSCLDQLKRMVALCLKPAIERVIICLQELQGVLTFFQHHHEPASLQQVTELLKHAKTALAQTLSLSHLLDVEAVIMQEFIRWCRFERERQERLKQDQEEPRLPITYDTLTVARYIERGFDHPKLEAMFTDKSFSIGSILETLARQTGDLVSSLLSGSVTNHHPLMTDKDSITFTAPVAQVSRSKPKILSLAKSELDDDKDDDNDNETDAVFRRSSDGNLLAVFDRQHFHLYQRIFSSSSSSPSSSASVDVQEAHFQFPLNNDSFFDIVDMGFFDSEQIVVILTHSDCSFLVIFRLSQLEFQTNCKNPPIDRVCQFPNGFIPKSICLNSNKSTVAVLDDQGIRILYLDLTVYDEEEQEEEEEMMQNE